MTVTLVESPGDLPEGASPIAVDQVDGELARRWKRADARRHVEITGEQLAQAVAAVTAKRAEVPLGLSGPEPDVEGLARAARSAHAAAAKAAGMQAELDGSGEAPVVNVAAERAVLDAEAYLHHVGGQHHGAVARGVRALYGANVVGMAVLAGRGATALAEPVMPLVALAPAGALALLTVGSLAGRRRRHEARLAFDRALSAAGVHSVAGLTARRARVDAWQRRHAEVVAAARAAERAHDRWVQAIGADVPPSALDQMLTAAASLRQAEQALHTAAAAHDEAVALAEGPAADAPLVIQGAPDGEQLDRLLQGSGGCPIVLIAPDPADRQRLAAQLSSSGEVIVVPERPEASGATDAAVAPPGPAVDDAPPEPAVDATPPVSSAEPDPAAAERPAPSTDLRERVLETLKKALSLRSPTS